MRYVDRQKERTEVTLLTTAICLGRIILEISHRLIILSARSINKSI